jgi:hypothetical protein
MSTMTTNVRHHALGLTWWEDTAMARAAHALKEDKHVWLIDPFDDADALAAAAELGAPSAVIQLLDRHGRDCAEIAERLNVPLLRVPAVVAGGPFEVVRVVSQRFWKEVALWWPERHALIVAEAVGTIPPFALGRPLGMHPFLRLTPPGSLQAFSPEILLVGHGAPLESGAAPALADALSHARSDTPKLLLQLPSLIRGG